MTSLRLIGTLALLTAALPAAADVVHLKNGSAFEDVLAEIVGDEVRIQMAYGEMRLPMTAVERVDDAESGFEEYLERKRQLVVGGAQAAADWLELARWARARDLTYGVREAATVAADLDPHLPGLAPVMRGLGWVLDADLDRWVVYADFMRRQGFVASGEGWISPEEADRRRAEAASRLEAERQARRDRAIELAELVLLRQAANEEPAPPAAPVAVYAPTSVVYTVPQTIARIHGSSLSGPRTVVALPEHPAFPSLLLRQPGSLLPIGHNRGVFSPPPKSP